MTDAPEPTPDVSVIVPVFNGADTIATQLQALVDQQVSFSWELLVCDNGSTDDTRSIVRGFQDHWPHIRIVDASARRGPAAARNIGAQSARAPLFVFCDADDQASPGWLARMHDALGSASIACGGWEGKLLNKDSTFALSWSPTAEYRKDYIPALAAGAGNNMAIRADVFVAMGGFEESMLTAEDIDLAWRSQLAGYRFVFVTDAVMHVRRRDGLRAVWTQAVSYGRGEFRLHHRYAKVIAAYQSEAQRRTDNTATNAATSTPPRSRNIVAMTRRFIAGGGRLHLADRLWQVGLRRGERMASADPAWVQIEPPATLPYN